MTGAPTRHLGDVASFVRGITFKPSDVIPVGSPDSVACMRTKNVQSELDVSDVWGIPESFVKRPDQYLLTGDLLVSSANSWNLVGKCCRVPQLQWPATFGGFISVLRGDPSQIEARYLYHWFSSPRIQATVRSYGRQTTNISNLNVDRCLRLWLPLPPLAEQRRIAGILDAADALRAKRREAIAQLDTLLQSAFVDMFGDPVANPMGWPRLSLLTLLEQAELFVDGDWVESKDQDPDGDVRLIQLADIGDGIYLDRSSRFLTSDTARRLRCTPLQVGDILVARMPDPLGRACLFPGDARKAITVVDICIIRPGSQGPHPTWLMCGINTMGFRSLIARAATGTTRLRISRGNLSKLPIIAPPVALQHRFAAIAESIDRRKAIQHAHLAELDTLFASLQARAFRGDL